jgi:hypothetical protein
MVAIHAAVVRSGGMDEYTGLLLRWNLIGTYDNELVSIRKPGSEAGTKR